MILKDGKLTRIARAISTTVGLICAIATTYFLDDLTNPILWILTAMAIIFGYGSAWSGLSEKWGYKPFTNDPLGWRAAKKSYDQQPDSEELGKIEKDPPKP